MGKKIKRAIRGVQGLFKPRYKILAYHSVYPVSRDPYEVTEQMFRKQMACLAEKGYRVLSLEDAIRDMVEGSITDKTIVLTFDDGFQTVWDVAVPIMKEFDFTATVFLPIEFVGKVDGFSYELPRNEIRLMDWGLIEKAISRGITFGSHSMSHRNLVDLDEKTLRFELEESMRILKTRLGLKFLPFAYPFGMFNEQVQNLVRETGYDCGLCFGNILSNASNTDRFELKREKILNGTGISDFEKLIDVKNDFFRKTRDGVNRRLPFNR